MNGLGWLMCLFVGRVAAGPTGVAWSWAILWHAVVYRFTLSGWPCYVGRWQRVFRCLGCLSWVMSPWIQNISKREIIAMELRPEDQRPLQVVPSLLGATACGQMSWANKKLTQWMPPWIWVCLLQLWICNFAPCLQIEAKICLPSDPFWEELAWDLHQRPSLESSHGHTVAHGYSWTRFVLAVVWLSWYSWEKSEVLNGSKL